MAVMRKNVRPQYVPNIITEATHEDSCFPHLFLKSIN